MFVTNTAPLDKINKNSPTISVWVADGQKAFSNGTGYLRLSDLPLETKLAHIMPGFPDSLISISILCNAGLHCTFTGDSVFAYSPITLKTKLQGWREVSGLWRFPLIDIKNTNNKCESPKQKTTPKFQANNAYDMPSTEASIAFHHASARFPIKETWYQAVKNNNYSSWPGLTAEAVAKYCPNADETIKGTMSQTCQGLWSTSSKGGQKQILVPDKKTKQKRNLSCPIKHTSS